MGIVFLVVDLQFSFTTHGECEHTIGGNFCTFPIMESWAGGGSAGESGDEIAFAWITYNGVVFTDDWDRVGRCCPPNSEGEVSNFCPPVEGSDGCPAISNCSTDKCECDEETGECGSCVGSPICEGYTP